jgi:hypothetical protein
MALVAGNLYKVSTFCRFNGVQNQVNNHYIRITQVTGINPAEVVFFQNLANTWRDLYKPLLPITTVFQGLKWKLVQLIATQEQITTVVGGGGSRLNDALAPQLAAVISVRASLAPVRTRGRIYVPSPTEDAEAVGGNLEAAYLGQLATFYDALKGQLAVPAGGTATADYFRVLYKKATNQDWIPDSRIIRTSFGTQRRRSLINRGDLPLA